MKKVSIMLFISIFVLMSFGKDIYAGDGIPYRDDTTESSDVSDGTGDSVSEDTEDVSEDSTSTSEDEEIYENVNTDSEEERLNYSGPLDIVTGRPLYTDGDTNEVSSVKLPDGSIYDAENKLYEYIIGDGSISVGVCDGMIVGSNVAFFINGDINVSVYKDGKYIEEVPETIVDVGSYMVISNENGVKEQVMSFQIVSDATGKVTHYILPEGFYLDSVYLDGEEVTSSSASVDMTQEGYYEISYTCDYNKVNYELDVVVDHTPPKVVFKGLGKNNQARGPVTLEGLTDEDDVYVERNGDEERLSHDAILTNTGYYNITITDQAGNTQTAEFRILVYLNTKSVLFFSLIILVLAGIGIALYINRIRLRVR